MTPQPGEALRQIRNLCAERHPHTPDETVAWLAVHELLRQMAAAPVAGEGLDVAGKLLDVALGIIEAADRRCEAADGPVTRIQAEMSDVEWRKLYVALTNARAALAANQPVAEAGEDSPESNEVLAASPVDGGSSAASLLPSEPMSNDGWRHRLIHLHSECPACLAATQPAAEERT